MWWYLNRYAGGSPDGVRAQVHVLLLFTQFAAGGYFVLAKNALSDGVHMLVFSVYRNFVGLLLLIPFAFFYERNTRVPITPVVLRKYIILGIVGVFLNQFLFYNGLSLTSATLASVMQILIPIFTIIIAYFRSVEVITWHHRSGQAKIVGVASSVAGAILMTVYKGPPLFEFNPTGQPQADLLLHQQLQVLRILADVFGFVMEPWTLGVLSLIGNTFCAATLINIQSVALAEHQAPVSLATSVFGIGSLFLALSGLIFVRDLEAWIISEPSSIIAVVYAGAVISCLAVGAIAWSISKTGPVLAASYAPLQAVATAILAVIFLKETFFLGSLIGCVLTILGLYLINWGQRASHSARDPEAQSNETTQVVTSSTPDIKVPLLGGLVLTC